MGWQGIKKTVVVLTLLVVLGLEVSLLSGIDYVRVDGERFGLEFGGMEGERKTYEEMKTVCGREGEGKEGEVCPYVDSLIAGGLTLEVLLGVSVVLGTLSLLHTLLAPYCLYRLITHLLSRRPLPVSLSLCPRCLTLSQLIAMTNPLFALGSIILYPILSQFPEISRSMDLEAGSGLIILPLEIVLRLFLYVYFLLEIVENRRQNSQLLPNKENGNLDDSVKAIHPAAASVDETRL